METSRRGVLGAAVALAASVPLTSRLHASPTRSKQNRIVPGALWLDTDGKPIQAHGASLIHVGKTFYWYGENKERTNGRDGVWHWGVRCYASEDLYNWRDLGLIIPPEPNDPKSPLNPMQGMDRPHIVYNTLTNKFVCWLKIIDLKGGAQTRTVLTADAIIGPWKIIASGIRPMGMNAGDFDLAIHPQEGKGYMYCNRPHTEIFCADLTNDYTGFTGYYSTHLARPGPPTAREGPAWFTRNGRQYLATSGVTGYFPNPTEIATADTFHGPWTTLGVLHRDSEMVSFDTQISSVFKHPDKKDLYIALADRWTAGVSREKWQQARRFYEKLGKLGGKPRDSSTWTADEMAGYQAVSMYKLATSEARYVWLPVLFDGDRPFIEWRDEWSIDEFT